MRYDLGVYETVTGRRVALLPWESLTWSTPLDDTGTASATVPLDVDELAGLNLRALTTPWKFALLASIGNQVQFFGPITPGRSYSADGKVTLPASELWAILKARPMIGNPNTVGQGGELPADLTLNDASMPGLAVRIVQHATSVVGGALPLRLPAITAAGDAHTRTYTGNQYTTAADALKALTDAQDGPEVRFDAEFLDSPQRARWVMRVG